MPALEEDPLWIAIENDRADELRKLLDAGRQPTYQSTDGWSPLHHAVDAECDFHNQVGAPLDLRLVGPLLEADADLNALWTTPAGVPQTPLDLALTYQHKPLIDAIGRAGGRSARDR